MGNNWSSELERRRAGEVPGFIGSDETIEHFERRTAGETDTPTVPAADATTPRTPAKKAARTRTAAKKR